MSTFAELKTSLAGRGFNHLTDAQLGEDINSARRALDHRFLWPYRESFATGLAPLYIADLGVIEAVTNETADYTLSPVSYRTLTGAGDTSASGSPEFFYVGSGNIVGTWPTNGDTIGVQYWKSTPELTSDSDEPDAPTDYQHIYVLIASQYAYLRTDASQAGANMQVFIDMQVDAMVNTLLGGQQITGPQDMTVVTDGSCDG